MVGVKAFFSLNYMIDDQYQTIISQQNSLIKKLKKLNLKKYRQEYACFIVENFTIIKDAVKDGYIFESLFITEQFIAKHRKDLDYLKIASHSTNIYLITPQVNKYYSSLETPSGITAIFHIKKANLSKSSVIYLNGVSDPGNLGTIMRSAVAFGYDNFVLDKNCVDIYNPKVINAAKDAIFKLNIIEDSSGNWLQINHLPIYTTDAALGIQLNKFKPAPVYCLVLGGESRGVSPEIIKQSQINLRIKISNKIESLNVAIAASIIFYEFSK